MKIALGKFARSGVGAVAVSASMVDVYAVSLLSLIASYGFRSVFGGSRYLAVAALGTLLGAMVGNVTLRRRLPALVAVGLLAIGMILGSGFVLPDLALLRFLPSPASVSGLFEGVVNGWVNIINTLPPLGGDGTTIVIPYFCAALGTFIAVVLALRTRSALLAVLPALAISGASILLGTAEPASVLIQGVLFALVVVVWTSARMRSQRVTTHGSSVRRLLSAVGLLAGAALLGHRLMPNLPLTSANERFTLRARAEPPFDPKDYPSPLNGYRKYVQEDLKERPMLKVVGLPKGVPLRIATFDSYDGVVWSVAGSYGETSGPSGYFQRVGVDLPIDSTGQSATIEVEVLEYSDVWLPTVGEISNLRFGGPRAPELSDAFRYNVKTETAAVPLRLQKGDTYQMDVVVPESYVSDDFSGRQLGALSYPGIDQIPDAVKTLAVDYVADVSSASERAETLADQLKNDGFYSDGQDGEFASRPGHNGGRLAEFVEAPKLVGNGEQYAATLGLMTRSLGMPSRVAMGFLPADPKSETVEIVGNDIDAWVEVLVDGIGWVPLYPTPDRDKKPTSETPKPKPKPDLPSQPPPPPPPVLDPPDELPVDDSLSDKGDEEEEKDKIPEKIAGIPTPVIIGVGSVIGLAALIAGFTALVAWLKRRRRRRRQSVQHKRDQLVMAWWEIEDTAQDLGSKFPKNLTKRERARLVPTDRAVTAADAVDQAVFGRTEPDDETLARVWNLVDAVGTELKAPLSRYRRWRATVSIRTLLPARGRRMSTKAVERARNGLASQHSGSDSDAPAGAEIGAGQGSDSEDRELSASGGQRS